jgi:hypothetical protein
MRITSDPFELQPGFEASGKQYTQAVVRLLTNNERSLADAAIRAKTAAELRSTQDRVKKEAGAAQGTELDTLLSFTIGQKVEQQHLFVLQIHAFIAADRTRVEDREQIEKFVGLLIETDEEEIIFQVEELRRRYQRPHFRPKHKCPDCSAEVECA